MHVLFAALIPGSEDSPLREKWIPALRIRAVLLFIQALLSAPNPDNPLNNEAAVSGSRTKLRPFALRKIGPKGML